MKKWPSIFVLCLFVLPLALAADDLYTAQYVEFDLTISSDVTIESPQMHPSVDYVETELLLVPQTTPRQRVLSLETSPQASEQLESLLYRWNNPDKKTLPFSLQTKVKTTNIPPLLRSSLAFPIQNVPPELIEFTQPSETIDSDHPAIVAKASELADGEDDLAQVIFKLASWTEESVEYDLSSLTAEASQRSSWVLENRVGVCDEMTSLFIAFARSLGIPGRFVSGMAFTTSELFSDNWQPHGWAEIYIPQVGWVPYDPTFGQYGALDPTHIKLQASLDPGEPSSRYEWRGTKVDLSFSPLNFDVKITKTGPQEEPSLNLKNTAHHEVIGFGSWNLIITEIENTQNYYQAATLRLAAPAEVTKLLDKQAILLKPGEKRSIYWPVALPLDLSNDFIYTFPVSVVTEKNVSAQTQFQSKRDEATYSKEDIDDIVAFSSFEKTTANRDAQVNCEPIDAMSGETFTITCSVKNSGNKILDATQACIAQKCITLNIAINQEKEFSASFKAGEPGRKKATVKLTSGTLKKLLHVTYQILDEPSVKITDVAVPAEVKYDQQATLSFVVAKDSYAPTRHLKVEVERNGLGQTFEIDQLEVEQRFNIQLLGSELDAGENVLSISVKWEDELGEKYSVSSSESIDLVELSITQRMSVFFKGLARGLEKLFS